MTIKELIIFGLIVFAMLWAHYWDERKRNKKQKRPCRWKELG